MLYVSACMLSRQIAVLQNADERFSSRAHVGLVVLGHIWTQSDSVIVCKERNHTSFQGRPLHHGKANKETKVVKKEL